jgi:hypothetical protein
MQDQHCSEERRLQDRQMAECIPYERMAIKQALW